MKKVRLTRTQAVPKLAESPTKFAPFALKKKLSEKKIGV